MPSPKKIHIEWEPRRSELIAAAICICALGFILAFVIIAYTPLRNLVPGYPSEDMKNEIAVNAMKIDSLERSIYRWELYSSNLRDILKGKPPVKIDSLLKMAGRTDNVEQYAGVPASDSVIRAEMTSRTKTGRYARNHGGQTLEGRHFFIPVKGRLTGPFELSLHPYVDIAAPAGTTVMAVLDGTVIFKDWNEIDGWSVVVQHSGGVISVYKHNDSILKNVADKVSAGTAIAILGNNPSGTSKEPHLHFELWHEGTPEDPARFMNFQQ